jgi:hypothetical protein
MDERRRGDGRADSTTDAESKPRARLTQSEPSAAVPEPTEEPLPTDPSESEASAGGIVGRLPSVSEVASAVGGAIGTVIGVANQAWSLRETPATRRLSRQAREPLANLYELYPEAREATPHELGLRFVPVEEILGTAVAGSTQRGGDFLPLKQLRGENWEARWQRIRNAIERLQPLPPVDLIKYDGDYWVVDGHNRVAATLYTNGTGLDAMVTELVPLDGQTSERPRHLLSYLGGSAELRAAAQGHRPAMGMRQTEQLSADEAAQIFVSGPTSWDESEFEIRPDPDEDAQPDAEPNDPSSWPPPQDRDD